MRSRYVYWAEHTSATPISVDEARRRIAENLDVEMNQITVTRVNPLSIETRNGLGLLIDYETAWEFQAEVRPKETQ